MVIWGRTNPSKAVHIFEEHNGLWAMPKASSHFLLTYSKNYQTITVECFVLLTYLQCTLWSASQSKGIFRDTGICNTDGQLFYHLPRSLSLQGNSWATSCPNTLSEEVPVSFCHVSPDFSASLLICNSPSVTSGWMFPWEMISSSSISAWCLCLRGLVM